MIARFSPDDNLVACGINALSGCNDGKIKIFNLNTSNKIVEI